MVVMLMVRAAKSPCTLATSLAAVVVLVTGAVVLQSSLVASASLTTAVDWTGTPTEGFPNAAASLSPVASLTAQVWWLENGSASGQRAKRFSLEVEETPPEWPHQNGETRLLRLPPTLWLSPVLQEWLPKPRLVKKMATRLLRLELASVRPTRPESSLALEAATVAAAPVLRQAVWACPVNEAAVEKEV